MELILVRHAQCGTSSIDDVLTEFGEQQALQIGKKLAAQPITAILSSPLLRALGTASIVAQQLGNRPIEIWPELREGLYGPYKGYTYQELQQRFPLALLLPPSKPVGWNYPADTQESMFQRCYQVLQALQERFKSGDTVVVITHGGMMTYLLHILLQIALQAPIWFDIQYGAINRIRFVPREEQEAYPPLYPTMEVEVLAINDVSHL